MFVRAAFAIPRWVALGLVLTETLTAGPLGAQIIAVPTFQVASVVNPGDLDVAVATDGTLLVVWSRFNAGTIEVYGRRFSPAGVALGPATRIDGGDTTAPSISARPGGGYAASWMHRAGGIAFELFGFSLDAEGLPVGSEVQANQFKNFVYGGNVAALPTGSVIVWTQVRGQLLTDVMARVFATNGQPLGDQFRVGGDGIDGRGITATSDGGFAICWQDHANNAAMVRTFAGNGSPRGAQQAVSFFLNAARIAASPIGTTGVVAGSSNLSVGLQRFTYNGTPVGGPTFPSNSIAWGVDVEYASDGNIFATWAQFDPESGTSRPRGGVFDAGLHPVLEPFWIADEGSLSSLRTARLADGGSFAVVWADDAAIYGAVVKLCTPANALCGDGVLEPACNEACDDGAANSDTVPDACRTDCRPAHCGDGVLDSGEVCDDGNLESCDGCDALCTVEVGLGCGDGVPYPTCGESCDDANLILGDGCTSQCSAERAPGGGAPSRDCFVEWSVDNPANTPLYADQGFINPDQRCVDNDPRCDFDGGLAGNCTFHVAVCGMNTNLSQCPPPTRVASWELARPSAKQALRMPAYANDRAAFLATVPAAIVGPSVPDLCSPPVPVEVPLRGVLGAYGLGRVTLKSVARSYAGGSDIDTLKLTCLPTVP